MSDLKTCTKCGETHFKSFYHARKEGKDGLKAQCKNCESARKKRYWQEKRDRPGQKMVCRAKRLKYNYGMTHEPRCSKYISA